jgi:hypothetical protein
MLNDAYDQILIVSKHLGCYSMLSLGIYGSRLKRPLANPLRIVQGLGGYTHQVRSCAPLD